MWSRRKTPRTRKVNVASIVTARNWCADSTNNAANPARKGGNMTNLRDFIETARYVPSQRALLDNELRATQIELGKLYAESEKMRQKLKKIKEKIARAEAKASKRVAVPGSHWTDRELSIAMDPALTDSEVAEKLGRTESAVRNKRHLIRRTYRPC